jgi:hypothetical protein
MAGDLEEKLGDNPEGPAQRPTKRGWVRVVAGTLIVVGASVGVALGTGGSVATSARSVQPLASGSAEQAVLTALTTTTQATSYNLSYDLTESPSTAPSTNCTTSPSGGGAETCVGPTDTSTSGQGTVNLNPFAMQVTALGSIVVQVDGTAAWEWNSGSGSDSQLSGSAGQPLSQYAGLVEGTLGSREGAAAMLHLSNPYGYLALTQAAIEAAEQTGTGTVDGVPVTDYEVSINPAQLVNSSEITPEEQTTIEEALNTLNQDGYQSTMINVAVDGAGFIREFTSVMTFSDAGTLTLQTIFSNFGCAGTIGVPGERPTPAAATCVSPDNPTQQSPAAGAPTPTTPVPGS